MIQQKYFNWGNKVARKQNRQEASLAEMTLSEK